MLALLYFGICHFFQFLIIVKFMRFKKSRERIDQLYCFAIFVYQLCIQRKNVSLYILLESHAIPRDICCNIYIYIREIQDTRSITSKLLPEEWTIEVYIEKIVDKKILRDNLPRVVTTGSMKSFVKYCRFLIARH